MNQNYQKSAKISAKKSAKMARNKNNIQNCETKVGLKCFKFLRKKFLANIFFSKIGENWNLGKNYRPKILKNQKLRFLALINRMNSLQKKLIDFSSKTDTKNLDTNLERGIFCFEKPPDNIFRDFGYNLHYAMLPKPFPITKKTFSFL